MVGAVNYMPEADRRQNARRRRRRKRPQAVNRPHKPLLRKTMWGIRPVAQEDEDKQYGSVLERLRARDRKASIVNKMRKDDSKAPAEDEEKGQFLKTSSHSPIKAKPIVPVAAEEAGDDDDCDHPSLLFHPDEFIARGLRQFEPRIVAPVSGAGCSISREAQVNALNHAMLVASYVGHRAAAHAFEALHCRAMTNVLSLLHGSGRHTVAEELRIVAHRSKLALRVHAARQRINNGEIADGGWWVHGGDDDLTDETEAEWRAEEEDEAFKEWRKAEEESELLTQSMNSTAAAIPLLASHWAHKYGRTPGQAAEFREARLGGLVG
eukprot:g62.t1